MNSKLDKNLLRGLIESSFKDTEGKERKFKGYIPYNLMKKALEDEIQTVVFKFFNYRKIR